MSDELIKFYPLSSPTYNQAGRSCESTTGSKPTSDEWRSDLLVTPTETMICLKKKKKKKKEATKRNVIYTKNWVTIGRSTLKIVRWYYHICRSHLEKQSCSRAVWPKPLKSASAGTSPPSTHGCPDTLTSHFQL